MTAAQQLAKELAKWTKILTRKKKITKPMIVTYEQDAI